MNADKAIFTSAMVTLGSTMSASILPASYGGQGKMPPARLLIGTGLAFTGLSILGDIAPRVAVPLAASVAITAFLYYGVPVMDRAFTEKHRARTPANQAKQPGVTSHGHTTTIDPFTITGGGEF